MWKLTRWRDLTKKSRLNINDMTAICDDLSELQINNLCISMPKYGIKTNLFDLGCHDYGEVQVIFDQFHRTASTTILEMHIRIYLGKHTIEAEVVGEAEYSEICDYYDGNMQDYLFTYFANILSSDKYLTRFGKLDLPDKLSNYYPACEWSPSIRTSYHRDSRGEPLSVERVSGKTTIPLILRVGIKQEKGEK